MQNSGFLCSFFGPLPDTNKDDDGDDDGKFPQQWTVIFSNILQCASEMTYIVSSGALKLYSNQPSLVQWVYC